MARAYFQSKFAMARNILTRVTALIFIFDDIHDIYGILEELVSYTRAIEKYVIHILFLRLMNLIKACVE